MKVPCLVPGCGAQSKNMKALKQHEWAHHGFPMVQMEVQMWCKCGANVGANVKVFVVFQVKVKIGFFGDWMS
jgi:hypothetical protein